MNKDKILTGIIAGVAVCAFASMISSYAKDSKAMKKINPSKKNYVKSARHNLITFLFSLIDKLTVDELKVCKSEKGFN